MEDYPDLNLVESALTTLHFITVIRMSPLAGYLRGKTPHQFQTMAEQMVLMVEHVAQPPSTAYLNMIAIVLNGKDEALGKFLGCMGPIFAGVLGMNMSSVTAKYNRAITSAMITNRYLATQIHKPK